MIDIDRLTALGFPIAHRAAAEITTLRAQVESAHNAGFTEASRIHGVEIESLRAQVDSLQQLCADNPGAVRWKAEADELRAYATQCATLAAAQASESGGQLRKAAEDDRPLQTRILEAMPPEPSGAFGWAKYRNECVEFVDRLRTALAQAGEPAAQLTKGD